MTLKILTIDDPKEREILRLGAEDVSDFNEEIHTICKAMIETMFASNGIGLAAPQIGMLYNIFVMQKDPSNSESKDSLVLINPKIILKSKDLYIDTEGCLSIPNVIGLVARSKELKCSYYDLTGQQNELVLTDLPARVFQHENDHLKGVLFTDRAIEVIDPRTKYY
jgi:peptide deformylase